MPFRKIERRKKRKKTETIVLLILLLISGLGLAYSVVVCLTTGYFKAPTHGKETAQELELASTHESEETLE